MEYTTMQFRVIISSKGGLAPRMLGIAGVDSSNKLFPVSAETTDDQFRLERAVRVLNSMDALPGEISDIDDPDQPFRSLTKIIDRDQPEFIDALVSYAQENFGIILNRVS